MSLIKHLKEARPDKNISKGKGEVSKVTGYLQCRKHIVNMNVNRLFYEQMDKTGSLCM